MSEPQPDEPAATSTPGKSPSKSPPPAEFASQVATLIGDDPPYQTNELPLWSRLGRSPRPISRWWPPLAWSMTIALLLIAVLRIVAHDRAVVLTWFNAFTLYLYLPAYLILVAAAWTRRWWLATASAAVVACHVMWVTPDFRAATPYRAPESMAAGTVVPLKIYYANVRGGANKQIDEVFAEAREANPDVIVLVELQTYWWRELMRRGPVPGYPYGTNLPNRNSGDVAVFSRLPVRRMEEVILETRSSLVLDIPLEQDGAKRGEVQIVALHSPRPTTSMIDNYYVFWDQMLPVIADRHGPQVVIGDFNATQHSRVYAELLALGLRSAHVDRGRGYVTTWPNGVRPFPPIRIDQSMLSPDVECVSVAEGTGPGSDHTPLILDLRIHLPAAPAQGG